MKLGRLVLIEWVDSGRNPNSWAAFDDYPDPYILRCRSVGWLIHDGSECKVVAPHVMCESGHASAPDQGCGDMTIPTCSITRMVDLEIPPGASQARL